MTLFCVVVETLNYANIMLRMVDLLFITSKCEKKSKIMHVILKYIKNVFSGYTH